MRQCRKIWWSQSGHKWHYNMAHTSCMLDKKGYTHAHAHVHAVGHKHQRPRARAHTHTQICNMYCFSTAKMTRERTSVLRYTYIACLVLLIRACCFVLTLVFSENSISFCRATAQLYVKASSFVRFVDHTQLETHKLDRTFLKESLARNWGLRDTQHTHTHKR